MITIPLYNILYSSNKSQYMNLNKTNHLFIDFSLRILILISFILSILGMKALVRNDIKAKLSSLSQLYIEEQSMKLVHRLNDSNIFKESSVLSSYLSMPNEISTYNIITTSFELGKRIFIPKVLGKNSIDMFMLEISSMDMLTSFTKNNWGIPEPSKELVSKSIDGTYQGIIDLVLVPGVAFDSTCARIGHGKGYYDCFIDRMNQYNDQNGFPKPFLLGLALDEQIVDNNVIPIDIHDQILDAVITPTRTFYKNKEESTYSR